MRRARTTSRTIVGVGVVAIALAGIAAVSVGALRADSAGNDEATFVSITPCRLFDTRPEFQVGPRSTPLSVGETHTLQVTGRSGRCSVPSGATAVSINLTGVDPSAPTFLAIFPADATNPGTSSLNMLPGDSPNSNQLDVALSAEGLVKVYNAFGTIHLLGDVMGYYLQSGLEALEGRVSSLESSQPFVVASEPIEQVVVRYVPTSIRDLTLTAPVAGQVTLAATGTASLPPDAGPYLKCGIMTAVEEPPSDVAVFWSKPADAWDVPIAASRVFDITAGATATYHLVCQNDAAGAGKIYAPRLTAIFTPAP